MTSNSSILSLDSPRFTSTALAEIVNEIFGIEGEITRLLASERDQVALFQGNDGVERVLKVSNQAEDALNVEFENRAAVWAVSTDPSLPLAAPLPTKSGEWQGTVEGHLIRLFPRLPGQASVPGASLSKDTIKEYGEMAARCAVALRGFFHPGAGRKLLWHLESLQEVWDKIGHLSRPKERALVERVLAGYFTRVAPRWGELRAQVVHSDLTLDNVLLHDGHVTGIIDLGDLTHTTLVADVAGAMTSLGDFITGEELFTAFRLFLDGYERICPLETVERHLLGDVMAARLATTVILAAWQSAVRPNNGDYLEGWVESAWSLLRQFDELGPETVARHLGSLEHGARGTDDLARARNQVLGSALVPLSYGQPVHLVRGEGATLTDFNGSILVDAYNNIPSVGYAHPRVARAISDQSRTLSTNLRYLHPAAIEFAERLIESMPEGSGLDTVLYVNSGSEANDLAWRIAQAATGRQGAIVTERAFHSISMAGTELSPGEWLLPRPSPRVETFRPGESLQESIRSLIDRGVAPGAVFIDPIYGSDGILQFSGDYHATLSAEVRTAGARLVVDEVQAGYGRTGLHLWSFAALGLEPDIVSLGKPMGNGYPVAAVIAKAADVAALGQEQELFSSFAGSPVAAAAGLAVLDIIHDEDLITQAAEKGHYLYERLMNEISGSPLFKGLHGIGLIQGLKFTRAGAARQVADAARQAGVLLSATGFEWDTIKIRPPLVISQTQLDRVVSTIAQSIRALQAR